MPIFKDIFKQISVAPTTYNRSTAQPGVIFCYFCYFLTRDEDEDPKHKTYSNFCENGKFSLKFDVFGVAINFEF